MAYSAEFVTDSASLAMAAARSGLIREGGRGQVGLQLSLPWNFLVCLGGFREGGRSRGQVCRVGHHHRSGRSRGQVCQVGHHHGAGLSSWSGHFVLLLPASMTTRGGCAPMTTRECRGRTRPATRAKQRRRVVACPLRAPMTTRECRGRTRPATRAKPRAKQRSAERGRSSAAPNAGEAAQRRTRAKQRSAERAG